MTPAQPPSDSACFKHSAIASSEMHLTETVLEGVSTAMACCLTVSPSVHVNMGYALLTGNSSSFNFFRPRYALINSKRRFSGSVAESRITGTPYLPSHISALSKYVFMYASKAWHSSTITIFPAKPK